MLQLLPQLNIIVHRFRSTLLPTKHMGVATLALLLWISASSFANDTPKPALGEWWNQPYPERFNAASLTHKMDFISVKGNKLVDEAGKTVILRGVNISDPDKLMKNGRWSKKHFEAVKSFGANVIRVPVHPAAWQSRGADGYFTLLDQAVRWANELDIYLIIDWHSIGNLQSELYQHPMYNTTKAETMEFWRKVAFRYKGVSTIAVYELFNEPTLYNGQLGEISWDQWREINEEIITIIYAHDTNVVPLVAGFNWAYNLNEVREKPFRKTGIAYAAHPYPTKTWAAADKKHIDWERDWGFVADTYPMITTEIGWMNAELPGAHEPVKDDGSYGPAILDYLNKKGASWTVWCFDPDWPPQMISDWDYTPTQQGEFFRNAMRKLNK